MASGVSEKFLKIMASGVSEKFLKIGYPKKKSIGESSVFLLVFY
jgi:hypothetical protein